MVSQSNTPDEPVISVRPPDHTAPLYLPRRSGSVPASAWTRWPKPVPAEWETLAHEKGFRINRRVRDRYHVALECHDCGSHTAMKAFVLRTAQPRCGGCAAQAQIETAKAAGLTFLRRCPDHRHYGLYRADCGHELRRQFEIINRVIKGQTDLRCEHCLAEREQGEASIWGWDRIGPDPSGRRGYRRYRHSCGHVQSIARANMAWGQCDCACCGESWASKPSFIYLVRLIFPEHGLTVIKLGFSGNPDKRFAHQLGLPPMAEIEFLRLIAMPSGHAACAAERPANTWLVKAHPNHVVAPDRYAGLINVVSEIYDPALLPVIHQLIDRIEAQHPPSR